MLEMLVVSVFGTPNSLSQSGLLLGVALLVGCGALSVYLFERVYPHIRLTKHSLWAMAFCLNFTGYLILCLASQQFMGLPACTAPIVLTAVGVFSQGRRYW